MLFFEPSSYEDFVLRLSSLRVKPPDGLWNSIKGELISKKTYQHRLRVRKFLAVASVLALFGIGVFSYFLMQKLTVSNNLSQADESFYSKPVERAQLSNQQFTEKKIIAQKTDSELYAEVKQNSHGVVNNDYIIPLSRIENTPKLSPRIEKLSIKNTAELSRNNNFSVEPKAINIRSPKKWTISGSLSPSFAFHTSGLEVVSHSSNDKGLWMWSGEVLAKAQINRNFSVSSGLYLSPMGQSIQNIILLTGSKGNNQMEGLIASTAYGWVSLDNQIFGIVNSTGLQKTPSSVIKSSKINRAELNQELYYLQIPLVFSCGYSAKSTTVEFKAGAAAGVLVGNKFELKGNKRSFTGKIDGVSPFTASFLAGICFTMNLNGGVGLFVEPALRINAMPLTYNETNTYPFSTSFKVGVSYRLKR